MKRTILPILLALCSTELVASSDVEEKPEFKAVRVYKIGSARDSCTILTSLHLEDVCYCSDAKIDDNMHKNASTFCQFDEITLLDADNTETRAHKLGRIAMREQIERFFKSAREEAEKKFGSSEVQVKDYINQLFNRLFKVTIEQ